MFRKARSVSQSSLISDRTAEASRRSEASLGKSVATRVERAPLPRHPSHDGLTGSQEPGVIATDDELYAVHAAFLQAFEEVPPRVELLEREAFDTLPRSAGRAIRLDKRQYVCRLHGR
jgi:hypothetical protein